MNKLWYSPLIYFNEVHVGLFGQNLLEVNIYIYTHTHAHNWLLLTSLVYVVGLC